MTAYDNNKTPLAVGDAVMSIHNGHELEGEIINILPDNHIVIESGDGLKQITVPASDVFILP